LSDIDKKTKQQIMEISIKTITLFAAITLTGLSAGFFYSWAVSVIPGTRKVVDITYMESMQSINREILNPWFFVVFFGCLILLAVSAFQQYHSSPAAFTLILIAAGAYLFGTFGVTALGNVPLNNALDVLDLNALSTDRIAEFRQYYEVKWNRLHMVRTVFSIVSFLTALGAAFIR
jgi:uncharacterized membrane protein